MSQTLGRERVHDPLFRNWAGIADPDDFPEGWALANSVATSFWTPGAGGAGARLVQGGGGAAIITDTAAGIIAGRNYVVEYELGVAPAGVFNLSVGAGANNALDGFPGRQTYIQPGGTTPVLAMAQGTQGAVDSTLIFLSVKDIITPPARSLKILISVADTSTGVIESAERHGVDVQLSGTLGAGTLALERSHNVGTTWELAYTFTKIGGGVVPSQSGWWYRVTSSADFVGSVTVHLRQA